MFQKTVKKYTEDIRMLEKNVKNYTELIRMFEKNGKNHTELIRMLYGTDTETSVFLYPSKH